MTLKLRYVRDEYDLSMWHCYDTAFNGKKISIIYRATLEESCLSEITEAIAGLSIDQICHDLDTVDRFILDFSKKEIDTFSFK